MRQETLAPWGELVAEAGPMTADGLLALPKDDWKYELVEGRLVRMSPTGQEHSDIWVRLFRALDIHVERQQLGMVNPPDAGYRLPDAGADDTVLSPDVSFISSANLALLPPRGSKERQKFAPLAPDLAVEIASPDQHRPVMAQKARRYLDAGTRMVWEVWPASRGIDIWRPGGDAPAATLGEGETLDGAEVVLGFLLPVAALFP